MSWQWVVLIAVILAFVFGLCWLSVWAGLRTRL